ncbi:MAG: hypothetical protein J6U42_02520, partial [Lachnospiraceae bacterium]|nr:hypothetical protein [Lachnospiraceae bacterium]
MVDVACQAAKDGFDEICFDYIRITSYTSGRTNTNFGRLIDYYTIQEQIVENCPEDQTTILVRRFMMRIAERMAKQEGSYMLITGESLG